MKKIIQTLTSLIFAISLVQPLHASKSEGIAIATAAGIAILAAFNNNSCENISDYKNYTVGIEMFTVPGNEMLNYKSNICKKDVISIIKKLNDTNELQFVVEPGKEISYDKLDNGDKRVNIAKTVLSSSELISGEKPTELYVNINNSGSVVSADEKLKALKGERLFKKSTAISPTKKTFSQEILYSGIEGNILHLQYREFFGKYIRDSFTQNITYDLSKGHLIRLKRFTIDIIDANNTKITYIIKN